MLLWTWIYKYLFEILLSIPLGAVYLFILFKELWIYSWKIKNGFKNWKENLMEEFGPLKCEPFKH